MGKNIKMGITNVNGQQVTININDTIPPENVATIDKGSLVGNTKSKEQLQVWQDEVEEKVNKISTSAIKGEATPTSSPTAYNPTDYPKGLYEKWEVKTEGTYTNFKDASNQSIVISSQDLDKKLAYINVTNGVSKKDIVDIPGVAVASEFDPTDNEQAQTGKQIAGYVNFSQKVLTYSVDLTKDNFTKYTQLTTNANFTEALNSTFGKVSVYKFTGGSVSFGSNFIPLEGSQTYDPSKTNVITFWKEYDNVRYFVEIFPLEPITQTYISYYKFNGKTANALLTSISPESGNAFTGSTGRFKINGSSTLLEATNNAGAISDSIAVNKGGISDYKVSIIMAFASSFQIAINGTSATDYSEYIDILRYIPAFPTSTIKQKTTANPAGTTLGTTTAIPSSAPNGYQVDIFVHGNLGQLFINGEYVCDIPVSGTGNYVSMIFVNSGDFMVDFKIEEL